MAVRLLFRISVLLVLTQIIYRAVTQQCTNGGYEVSILGWMLQKHIYDTMFAERPDACLIACRKDDRCQSFNYVISLSTCEFNNRTKEARPEDFVPNPDRFYFRRDMKRVPLGSIPELPAETCKEIKASEEGQAVSKKYWLSNIKPGNPVLAYCNMTTEDIDECTASPSVCENVNAICKNNKGSYLCSCKVGFTGDGKNCKDINECTASPSVCDVNANCQNNKGSYLCSCKVGFTGDGKNCKDVDECSANSHSCNVNAVCNNTQGSHTCSCKPGYSGDGRTCTDIDECVSGNHGCHQSASCTNTVGSYSCSCDHPYTGNEETCNLAAECQNHQRLTSAYRKVTYGHGHDCDSGLGPGWFRFQGSAGTRMATSCPPYKMCNTHDTGWMNGGHPTVAGGQVSRTVCFRNGGNCCYLSTNIKVRNCGSFYVYYLSGTPGSACDLRYCGTD